MRKRYRALAPLAYPTNRRVIERILKGESVSWEERRVKEVAEGEIVSDIPEASVGWLLEAGLIEEVGDDSSRLI